MIVLVIFMGTIALYLAALVWRANRADRKRRFNEQNFKSHERNRREMSKL